MTVSRREEYRRKLLGAQTAQRKIVHAFELDIELRQPKLSDVIGADGDNENMSPAERTQRSVANYLTQMAYIPDTDERIFEEADFPAIMSMPFCKDFLDIQNAINELTGIDVEAAEKELEADPLD